MRNNFLISYDLIGLARDYKPVHDAIKSLGNWYQLQYSAFYVNTAYTAEQCDSIVSAVLLRNDRLLIGDPRFVLIRGISQSDIDAINRVWFADAAAYAA